MADNKEYERGFITVKGLVIPMEWSSAGEPVGVSISTYNEIDYRVEAGRHDEELLKLLHREIEAKGRVWVMPNGELVLQVTEIHPTGRPRTGRRKKY